MLFALSFIMCSVMTVFAQTVTVYVDHNRTGPNADLRPGEYRLDQGAVPRVPNDSISSLAVPFGMSMTAWVDVEDGRGAGDSQIYEPGIYPFVGDDANDKFSFLQVWDFASTYFSTDDSSVPSGFDVSFKDGNLHVGFNVTPGAEYHKVYTYDVPPSCTPEWWESTKNGASGSTARFDEPTRKLTIDLMVQVRAVASNRNWVGVRYRCKNPNSRSQPRLTEGVSLRRTRTYR